MTVKNLYQVRQLGDRHNFDKTTYLRSDSKVIKQRNTSWEMAFLCAHSPLRQFIDSICRGAGMNTPLPDLYYKLYLTVRQLNFLVGPASKLKKT